MLVNAGYRIRQFLRALEERRAFVDDGFISLYLDGRRVSEFQKMSRRDQVHSVRTARALARSAGRDRDLVVAGLLHDIGKGEQNLWQRVVYVLAMATAPVLCRRLGRPGDDWRGAIFRAHHHPRRGAEIARELGFGEGVCQLIAHHHDAAIDPRLEALERADRLA